MTQLPILGMNRRTLLKAGAAAGLAATFPPGGAQAAPKKGGTMRMGKGHGQTTDTLDPGTATNGFTIALLFGMHGYLTEVGADGSLQPGVAESWEG